MMSRRAHTRDSRCPRGEAMTHGSHCIMKRSAVPLATLVLIHMTVALGQPARASAEPPVEVWFKGFKTEYLDGLFRAKPHLATFMGDHRFDDKLPDLSPAS